MKIYVYTVQWEEAKTGKIHVIPFRSSCLPDAKRRRQHARAFFDDSVYVSDIHEVPGKVTISFEPSRKEAEILGNETPNLAGIPAKRTGYKRTRK